MSGVRWTDLLSEYSTKERVISPTLFVLKVPSEVPHDCGTARFNVGMYLWDPFRMKRRSPLNPVSCSTLIVLCLTISLSLMSLTLSLSSFGCFKDLFRCFFFELSLLFGLFRNFPGLALRELRVLSPKTLSIATLAVTFPVLEFSIAISFSLALIVSSASLVALIGRVSVDFKWMPEGCSNLRHLSTGLLVLLDPLS